MELTLDFVNDRELIFLLRHKEILTKNERKLLNELYEIYQDNDCYDEIIKTRLTKKGLIVLVNDEGNWDNAGNWIFDNPIETHYYRTNKKGELYLKTSRFKSEYFSEKRNRLLWLVSITSALFAILAVVLSIITFIRS